MRIFKKISGLGTGSFLLLCNDFDADGKKEILTEVTDGELAIIDPFTEIVKHNISIDGKISYATLLDIDNDNELEAILCYCPNRVAYLKDMNIIPLCELISIPTMCFSLEIKNNTYLAILTATFSIEFARKNEIIGRFQCVPPIALSKPFNINEFTQEFFVLDTTGVLVGIKITDKKISVKKYLQIPSKPIHAELVKSDGNIYLIIASGNRLEIWDLERKFIVFKMNVPFRIIKLLSADFNGDSQQEIVIIYSSQLSTIVHVLDLKSFEDIFSLEINGFWIPILVRDVNKDHCDEILLRDYETKLRVIGLTYTDVIDLNHTITACEICDVDNDGSNEILVRGVNEVTILKTT